MALIQMYPLKGTIQHYSWGGYVFIPDLLGMENKQQEPFAEYWLGAHPNYPSLLQKDGLTRLDEFIREHPKEILGEKLAASFNGLPYLLKILDVRQMLSIQVHPDKRSAQKEFEEENKKAIPLTAPHRNYKDPNHKPEMMVALSDFWLLHGFKSPAAIIETINKEPEFNFLKVVFEQEGYKGLYEKIMFLEQEAVDKILHPLLQRITPLYGAGVSEKSDPGFWAARAAQHFCTNGHYDRGIFSVYLFNLVQLKKGQGIFQGPGLPHAYLEGQNVEVMANSDNVLRAGLTDKHIDISELLKQVKFEETVPKIISNENHYQNPSEEFDLFRYELEKEGINYTTESPEILFILDGGVSVKTPAMEKTVKKGEALFIIAGADLVITPEGKSTVFRVGTKPV
jgi:mannose-6-phosphate isomerase